MNAHRCFEDLPVWQDSRRLATEVYRVTKRAPFCSDRRLCDQIQAAVVSVCSNIAEGHERGSTADLVQFLFIAKGSVGEVRSQLYNAEDAGYLSGDEAEKLRSQARDIGRQLSAWIQSMQTPGFKGGPRFHKEPDRAWERYCARAGMVRMPDGTFKRKTEDGTGEKTEDRTRRKTEDGTGEKMEDGKSEDGRSETEDGRSDTENENTGTRDYLR